MDNQPISKLMKISRGSLALHQGCLHMYTPKVQRLAPEKIVFPERNGSFSNKVGPYQLQMELQPLSRFITPVAHL